MTDQQEYIETCIEALNLGNQYVAAWSIKEKVEEEIPEEKGEHLKQKFAKSLENYFRATEILSNSTDEPIPRDILEGKFARSQAAFEDFLEVLWENSPEEYRGHLAQLPETTEEIYTNILESLGNEEVEEQTKYGDLC